MRKCQFVPGDFKLGIDVSCCVFESVYRTSLFPSCMVLSEVLHTYENRKEQKMHDKHFDRKGKRADADVVQCQCEIAPRPPSELTSGGSKSEAGMLLSHIKDPLQNCGSNLWGVQSLFKHYFFSMQARWLRDLLVVRFHCIPTGFSDFKDRIVLCTARQDLRY